MTTPGEPRDHAPRAALVLAAGFGTRLQPFSAHTPKPLFTLNRQPLLDIMIRRLAEAGVRTVIVNTHHHHRQIEAFLRKQSYDAAVVTRYEPDILGTGGAIRNTADIWHPGPLLVVNSDIWTDIDFRAFHRFHRSHGQPVSLALCDHAEFNSVAVDPTGRVAGFRADGDAGSAPALRRLTFTGIQLLDAAVLAYLPAEGFAASIDAFQAMLDDGHPIRAFIAEGTRWSDLGTPERYRAMAREVMAACALRQSGAGEKAAAPDWHPLAGDGSDRRWYRLTAGPTRMIVADHGIKPSAATCEAESFVAIARHLAGRGLPVPGILLEDTFAGLVFMEDLGSWNLQARIQASSDPAGVEADYRRLVDILLDMALEGGRDFDPRWAWQTARYDRDVVFDRECRYFVEAFVADYLGVRVAFETLAPECRRLADVIDAIRPLGFMHRDFQSRNIMVHDETFFLIDFQAGRIGPPHYDLAALLIDPYVDLPTVLQEKLLEYFARRLAARCGISAAAIRRDYRYCALARNLQILGAYGFLTRRKGKPFFARFIPAAARRLQHTLSHFEKDDFPELARMAHETIPRYLHTP